ncbi:serine hydrolase domain-containing protein [Kribbella yunnanensis]|uniref:Serine hydrolase domain-containing protein n=2 Tax=Kribbella yunnanensis TaxID=190194 RepID=A0ABP4UV39_9ACTN
MTSEELQARLSELAAGILVPGAAAAILTGDEVVTAVTGTANKNTGADVVPETLFAAGSITKVFTASLVMTLVDEGLVELDAPVQKYLPDFTLTDPVRSAAVTVRMLLSHTSGMPNSDLLDDPTGPDAVAMFMERLKTVPIMGTPGKQFSYSNSGMVTLGRIVEVITKLSYDEALQQRILRPLGLNATTDAERMILGPTAIGHLADPAAGTAQPAPVFRKYYGNAPAGSTLWLDVAALIGFARMHLDGGRAADGRQVLSENSVTAMRVPQIDNWGGYPYPLWGLGWGAVEVDGRRVVVHGGGNIGMASTLWVIPDRNAAVAVLTNSTSGHGLNAVLAAEILAREFGFVLPAPPSAPQEPVPVDPTPYVGRYTSSQGDLVVFSEEGRLFVAQKPEPGLAEAQKLMAGIAPSELTHMPMTCIDAERSRFLVQMGPEGAPLGFVPMDFLEPDADGRPRLARFTFLAERVD